MKYSLYLFSILLFLGSFAVHFTVYTAYADDNQIQPKPKPVEATSVNSSKSNSSERQVQPKPKPVEGTTIKTTKSNTFRQVQPVPEEEEELQMRQIQPAPEPVEGKKKESKSKTSE